LVILFYVFVGLSTIFYFRSLGWLFMGREWAFTNYSPQSIGKAREDGAGGLTASEDLGHGQVAALV